LKDSTKARFDKVIALKKEGFSTREACEKIGIAPSYFYLLTKRISNTTKHKKPASKKKPRLEIVSDSFPVSQNQVPFQIIGSVDEIIRFMKGFQ
jgi:hypothetical protein